MNSLGSDNLEKVSQRQLDEIIKKHHAFLKGVRGGARAVLKFKDMSGLDFHRCDLSQSDFTGSVLSGANMAGGVFKGVSFFACDLRNANLENAVFARADFRGAFVAGANLTGADLMGADLREGKVMERGKKGVLQDKPGGEMVEKTHKTVFTGAKMKETNLSGARAMAADFSDADLSGVIIKDANFNGANLSGANLSKADFSGTNLTNSNLHGAIMSGTILVATETGGSNIKEALTQEASGGKFADLKKPLAQLLEDHTAWVSSAGKKGNRLDLSSIDMRDVANLSQYPLTAIKAVEAKFMGQNLSGIGMQSAQLDRADFRDCKMTKADLRGSSLKGAMLSRADLSEANLAALQFPVAGGAHWLQRVNLSGANLRYAVLRGADLRDAIMTGADLTYAILIDCDLRRADLTGALLDNADLSGAQTEEALIDARFRSA